MFYVNAAIAIGSPCFERMYFSDVKDVIFQSSPMERLYEPGVHLFQEPPCKYFKSDAVSCSDINPLSRRHEPITGGLELSVGVPGPNRKWVECYGGGVQVWDQVNRSARIYNSGMYGTHGHKFARAFWEHVVNATMDTAMLRASCGVKDQGILNVLVSTFDPDGGVKIPSFIPLHASYNRDFAVARGELSLSVSATTGQLLGQGMQNAIVLSLYHHWQNHKDTGKTIGDIFSEARACAITYGHVRAC